ncbi:MAG: hypothetical protein MN733_18815 [Nitrososphaera sp.]|nr:hypothetical protein [Nitrososphaera sp.]
MDGIEDYYEDKRKEADRLVDEIQDAEQRGETHEFVRALMKRLERARYTGD